MADFDFLATMIDLVTNLLDFLFQWLGMAIAETGRAAMTNAIR
ncbi:MAG TPA: hypothetical protein P5081_07290 [Phycisphaerae bacterium]|nr:hypothetical protein [Phycisphaerae bacterium]HRW52674.1 hypothetical protein [Phycisphaerae bacterium]